MDCLIKRVKVGNKMNLIEKIKNYKTKKKLIEENIRLKARLGVCWKAPVPAVTEKRNIQKIKCSMEVDRIDLERGITMEHIKLNIANKMLEDIIPFIEFESSDNPWDLIRIGGRVYTGTLYIATGDRKYDNMENDCRN